MKIEILLLFTACSMSIFFCALLIPFLKKKKAGQYILGYVEEHKNKSGTPTMGGLGFVAAAAVTAAIFGLLRERRLAVILAFGVAFTLVGFLDDYIKFRYQRNLGLRAWQKTAFQLAVSLLAGLFCYTNGYSVLYIPFFGNVDIGLWIVPLAVLVFVATVNSVNLTDGLDGLAASVSFWYFGAFALLLFLQGQNKDIIDFALILCGVLAGYLVFNTNKASVFMGDTGSLGLGGFAAAIAMLSGNVLFIPLIGIMFVVSSISVILQVIYYKKTKRRIFLMAPLHHHFQKKGYTESKIVYMYSLITVAAGLLAVSFV